MTDELKNKLMKSEKPVTVEQYISANIDKIKEALPEHITAERMARLLLITIRNNPGIAKCSQLSIIGAFLQCVQLSIEPTSIGHVYFVPYYNRKLQSYECQFQIGYQGILELVRRSGFIRNIYAKAVYENDFFEFSYGTGAFLKHTPNLQDKGKMKAAYMFVEFKDGGTGFHVMGVSELDAVMRRAKSKDDSGNIVGPWATDYEAMCLKTVIKRGCKYLPSSITEKQWIYADETTKRDIAPNMASETKDETDWESEDIKFDGVPEDKPEEKPVK